MNGQANASGGEQLLSRDEWHPIATVPMDGTSVVVFCDDWREDDRLSLQPIIAAFDVDSGLWVGDDGHTFFGAPTLWAPLIAPPAETG